MVRVFYCRRAKFDRAVAATEERLDHGLINLQLLGGSYAAGGQVRLFMVVSPNTRRDNL